MPDKHDLAELQKHWEWSHHKAGEADYLVRGKAHWWLDYLDLDADGNGEAYALAVYE